MPFEPDPSVPARELASIRLQAERLARDAYDRAIETFDGASQEVTAAFAAARWPMLELEPWIFRLDGKPVAAALVMVWSVPARLCSIAALKRGPVLADEESPMRAAVYAAAIDHLTAEYAHRRRMMLSVFPRAEIAPPVDAVECLDKRGFRAGARLPYPNFYFVRIAPCGASQRRSYAQKWRYHLARSEKQGLVCEAADMAQLPRFEALYEAMCSRKRFPDYSAYRTLPDLLRDLPDSMKPRLFFVTKDGEDIAGAVIFTAGRTAAYLYGATVEKALPLRAGYFMQDRVVSWLRANCRARWYDLGGTDGFHGLHQFKKGMVGADGLISPTPPVANYASRRRAKLLGLVVYSVRNTAQTLRGVIHNALSGRARPDQDREP